MFDFLPIKKAGERVHTLSHKKVMREWFAVFCDTNRTRWSLWMSNGDRMDNLFTDQLRDILGYIAENKCDRTKRDIKILCFINKIELAYILADVSFDYGWKKEAYYCISKDFVFVNAEPFDKKEFTDIEKMIEIICSFNTEVYCLRATQASNAKRMFFRDIRESCWKDTVNHKRIFKRVKTYEDMCSGSTAGFLRTEPETCGIIVPNVSSFDKSSAYPSKFVSIDKFPLTVPKIYNSSNKTGFLNYLYTNGKWFQIVIQTEDYLGIYMQYFKSKFYKTYALNNYDFEIASMDQRIWDSFMYTLKNYRWKLYYSDEQGYLLDEFRSKIVEEWNEKENAKSKIERKKHKTQLDMLYGKAIQRNDFNSNSQLWAYYNHDGSKYLLPHWSRMAISSTKLEVMKTWATTDKTVSADTDSVKSYENLIRLKKSFDAINDKIREANFISGFNCDIGVWRYEYTADRFLQLTHKQYIYEVNGEIHCTLSSFSEQELYESIKGMSNDEIFRFFKSRPEIPVCQGLEYNPFLDNITRITKDVKVGVLHE